MSHSRQTGNLRLKRLQEHTEFKGEQLASECSRFHRLAQEDQAPRAISSFNLFQTPEEIADIMVQELGMRRRVLEPSAGLGRLYVPYREANPETEITLVEISPGCCRELYLLTENDNSITILQRDFLGTVGMVCYFDGILMNPPFKHGADIRHIEYALTMLAPGGRLVSLCYWGVKQKKRFANCDVRFLPPGSFKSEGTNADVAMVVIDN
ncbi:class I SAM-dependent methyltransferase [Gimesia fumaroli]|uniref:Methyltransferase small domain protein n=1 Tax=Gimesia fumaroli TaxID=2527976 RepID=A0A518I9B5_9PLAN|nr:class I SAM-dependent methyltransferase [Gimesia fumaroli]QDV49592.1 Methyltransferase small domain protein [Gimesia fumaroli]